jgi:uncharacterized membrane protein
MILLSKIGQMRFDRDIVSTIKKKRNIRILINILLLYILTIVKDMLLNKLSKYKNQSHISINHVIISYIG